MSWAWPLVVQGHVAHSCQLEHSISSALESGSGTGWNLVRGSPGTSGRCSRQERLSVCGTCSLEELSARPAAVVGELADIEAHTQGNRADF